MTSATGIAEPLERDAEIVIEPGGAIRHYWRDLWHYRELFYILSWRDVAVRYKQTVAGAGWAVVQPFVSMVIMSVIFGKIAGLPSEGRAPYPLLVFAGMLPWQFFSNALLASSQSLASNANLVSKVYFPRLIVPASPVLVSLIDFAVSAVVLVAMMVWFQFWPTWRVVTLPAFVGLAIVAAFGPALLICAMTVKYRDFRFVIPFLMQFGLYISPVAYSSAVVRERIGEPLFLLYAVNPMVGVIDGFRWALVGQGAIFWPGFLISSLCAVVMFVAGLRYFRTTERTFADLV
ncbi:MAG: ABC transporter permease [Acidobacteria bacterium]|nr:ABC transporter permease [Acidobacteriota bacterium]